MTIDLIAEGVVAVLLIVTVAYCFQLNRRLVALRGEQEAMADLVTGLNQATMRAQEGVFQLRAASQESEETLKKEISRARALSDELALITEAGGNLAERIEKGLTSARMGAGEEKDRAARRGPLVRENARPETGWNAREGGNSTGEDIRRALSAAR